METVRTDSPSVNPQPPSRPALRLAVRSGFFILPARGSGVVELYGQSGRVIRYDPQLPTTELTMGIVEILARAAD